MDKHRLVLALQAGCVLLLLAAAAIAVFGLQPHNSLPHRPTSVSLPLASVSGPVLQLELVWRDADIAKILDPTDDPGIRDLDILDARRGNEIDSWFFIPAYSALLLALASLSWVCAAWPRKSVFLAVCASIGVVAVADWSENYGIAQALDHLATGTIRVGDAVRISNPSLLKWTLIGLVLALTGVTFIKAARLWTRIVGGLLIVVALLDAYGLLAYTCERTRSASMSSESSAASAWRGRGEALVGREHG